MGTAPSEPLADRLCTLGESVGKKGRTAPHLGEDSSGKSGCFSSIIWKATAASKLVGKGVGGGERKAIYKAISASTETAITQSYFLKFGLSSLLWRQGNTGNSASNQGRHRGWGESHKGRGALPCSSQPELLLENHSLGF